MKTEKPVTQFIAFFISQSDLLYKIAIFNNQLYDELSVQVQEMPTF